MQIVQKTASLTIVSAWRFNSIFSQSSSSLSILVDDILTIGMKENNRLADQGLLHTAMQPNKQLTSLLLLFFAQLNTQKLKPIKDRSNRVLIHHVKGTDTEDDAINYAFLFLLFLSTFNKTTTKINGWKTSTFHTTSTKLTLRTEVNPTLPTSHIVDISPTHSHTVSHTHRVSQKLYFEHQN